MIIQLMRRKMNMAVTDTQYCQPNYIYGTYIDNNGGFNDIDNDGGFNDYVRTLKTRIKKTQIYQYYINHKENISLQKIIAVNKYATDSGSFLANCYNNMINKGMDDIIIEIIYKCNPTDPDLLTIGNISVVRKRYDFLEVIYEQGHKLDWEKNMRTSFLTTAIRLNDVDMCKFLIDHEINPFNDLDAMRSAYSSDNDEIFNYIMSFDFNIANINQSYLQKLYSSLLSLSKNKRMVRTNDLIEKGLDLNIKDTIILYWMGNYEVDEMQYLMSNGFIPTDHLLSYAFYFGNVNLIEYLLNHGLKFNKDVTKTIIDANVSKGKILEISQLLIKYDADFSLIQASDSCLQILSRLSGNGLKKSFLGYVIEKCNRDHNMSYYGNMSDYDMAPAYGAVMPKPYFHQ